MGLLQNMAGMGGMTEQVIASDLLLSCKSSVWAYAAAISETASPELRKVLRKHLDAEIRNQWNVADYMIDRGFYHVKDPREQARLDLETAETAIHLDRD